MNRIRESVLGGGPQCGIIAGRRELIERIRKHPLFRALRLDKLAIAALAATLRDYLRGNFEAIPALRMIRSSESEIASRAATLLSSLQPLLASDSSECRLIEGESVIGGGSTPEQQLPTRLIELSSSRWTASELESRLRTPETGTAVLARILHDRVVVDLRTVFPEQEQALVSAIAVALS